MTPSQPQPHPRHRGLPFLHRNWLKATNHWHNMGNKLSSPSENGGAGLNGLDGAQRPAKRRRIDTDYDGFPLFEGYATAQRALRIEVLKISHKDAPRVKNGILNGVVAPNVRDVVHVRARCKLTICGYKAGEPVVLHVDSQLCDLRLFKNPAGSTPMARFSSIRPFHVPEEKIFLERDDDAVFGLASSYSILVELESAGDMHWPPADLVPITDEDTFHNRTLPSRQWVLAASIADLFATRNRKTARLRVKKEAAADAANTNFYLDLDVRWMTPISSQLRPREYSKDVQPSISVIDPHEPPASHPNGDAAPTVAVNGDAGHRIDSQVNGVKDVKPRLPTPGAALNEHADELAEGELTPSRSRRARQDINYNVKQMWNNAVGREPRKRRKQGDEGGQPDEHSITYLLPPEQVQTDKFACLLCGAENHRLSQLRAHYQCHPQYEFRFESRPKAGCCVMVKPVANGHGSPLRPRVYQLGLPVKPLDLDKYVNGDDSWVTSRLGPDNDREVNGPADPKAARTIPPAKRTRKKILVPKTKQPLFDPLSKVQLQPGQPIPQHEIDDSWLLLKHRDNLQDFIDLDPAEKEYLQEWDAFILRKHLSSEQYLPRHFLHFVRDRASWLVARRCRADEFSKHVAILLARRVLPEPAVLEATRLLNDARARRAALGLGEGEGDDADDRPPRTKATGGCCARCGKSVPVPTMVVCANKACANRLYHDRCVDNPDEASAMGRRWKCKACAAAGA
ncbi:hypothetical protein VTJ83DRAFT_6669 [Remersonia thermophila]|uniref:Polycomb protein VEFS-Box domain-containing protein n=1 Tax=Remersonia thermophila TaxID=72144 RepID=A0ABR4D5E2_9PEZI